MFDELNKAIDDYQTQWQAFISQRKNKTFFEQLKPTSVGWKVADLAEYDRLFTLWREACDQIHVGRLNDRWLAAMHLQKSQLHSGIELIKLMQRRPSSSDALGLDHVDFFVDMSKADAQAILEKEDIKWTDEENGLCKWISIWFDNTEAKLRLQETVFNVAIAELQAVNKRVLEGVQK